MVNILYINSYREDYLADTLLIGLKETPEITVYEFPVNNIIYKGSTNQPPVSRFHGKGFSVSNIITKEYSIPYGHQLDVERFDLVVFSSIHRQFGLFLQLLPYLNRSKTVFLDGEDGPPIFPFMGMYWRKPFWGLLPTIHRDFLYFKRELIETEINFYRNYKLLPKFICALLPVSEKLKEISFSIPEQKIVSTLPEKKKQFTTHIVDEEVAINANGQTSYAFSTEEEYYKDIQNSKFGITTKRAGWDCMRHYEIAANGTVICFRDLDKKPKRCAPHGLIPGVNCISYSSWQDLKHQINTLSENKYIALQKGSWEWAKENSSKQRAYKVLSTCGISIK